MRFLLGVDCEVEGCRRLLARQIRSAAGLQGGGRMFLAASFALHDQRRAKLVVPVNDLAMHAVDAFVRVNLTERMDRAHRALLGAELAFNVALLTSLQPVEHSR